MDVTMDVLGAIKWRSDDGGKRLAVQLCSDAPSFGAAVQPDLFIQVFCRRSAPSFKPRILATVDRTKLPFAASSPAFSSSPFFHFLQISASSSVRLKTISFSINLLLGRPYHHTAVCYFVRRCGPSPFFKFLQIPASLSLRQNSVCSFVDSLLGRLYHATAVRYFICRRGSSPFFLFLQISASRGPWFAIIVQEFDPPFSFGCLVIRSIYRSWFVRYSVRRFVGSPLAGPTVLIRPSLVAILCFPRLVLIGGSGSSFDGSLDASLAVSSALEASPVIDAASSSDEGPDVVVKSFLRSLSYDASLSLGLSLANRCGNESIFYGPPGSFGFYLFPLEHDFIMPSFSYFEVGVLDYLGCLPSMLSPNLLRGNISTFKLDPLGGIGGERPPWWFGVDEVSRFPCDWVPPYEVHPRPELAKISSKQSSSQSGRLDSRRSQDIARPPPAETVDPTGKHKACSIENIPAEGSSKKGKAVLTSDESRVFRHVTNRSPVPSWPEVGPIPRAATENSLFKNSYDAAATVNEYEDARDARNAKVVESAREVMVSSRETKLDLDASTARVALLEAELSESKKLVEVARIAEASQKALVGSLEAQVSSLETQVGLLRGQVVGKEAVISTQSSEEEVEEEIDRGQDNARWGWDNFRAQLEHLNPELKYNTSSMRIDWEVVNGVFAVIPHEGSVTDEAGMGDGLANTTRRSGGSAGLAVSPESDCAPADDSNLLAGGVPMVVGVPDSDSPYGPPIVTCPDGALASPSSDEVSIVVVSVIKFARLVTILLMHLPEPYLLYVTWMDPLIARICLVFLHSINCLVA
ncbi:uncharacterized protein G2W53_015444 [Senna tora]|uniref:Uncharacterized protein n=1 Tax=Senna tora TaxID=362788 RepID=A0A835C4V6_9FABA|nr:uncharacterized protein G2W53_015444 [Senna tora]